MFRDTERGTSDVFEPDGTFVGTSGSSSPWPETFSAVRVPDVAFVHRERVASRPPETGFWRGAPDLAVDINSPSNSASNSLQTVNEYLDAGVRLIWMVDPPTRTVTIYRSRDDIRIIGADDEIDGADVLPAFRHRVRALLGD